MGEKQTNKAKAPATSNQRKGFKVGEILARVTDDDRLLLVFCFSENQEEVCDVTDELVAHSHSQLVKALRELELEAMPREQ